MVFVIHVNTFTPHLRPSNTKLCTRPYIVNIVIVVIIIIIYINLLSYQNYYYLS